MTCYWGSIDFYGGARLTEWILALFLLVCYFCSSRNRMSSSHRASKAIAGCEAENSSLEQFSSSPRATLPVSVSSSTGLSLCCRTPLTISYGRRELLRIAEETTTSRAPSVDSKTAGVIFSFRRHGEWRLMLASASDLQSERASERQHACVAFVCGDLDDREESDLCECCGSASRLVRTPRGLIGQSL